MKKLKYSIIGATMACLCSGAYAKTSVAESINKTNVAESFNKISKIRTTKETRNYGDSEFEDMMEAGRWVIRAGGIGFFDFFKDNKKAVEATYTATNPLLRGVVGKPYEFNTVSIAAAASIAFVSNSGFGFELGATYPTELELSHEFSDRTVTTVSTSIPAAAKQVIAGIDFMQVTGALQYHFNPTGEISPFIGAGLAFNRYKLKLKNSGVTNGVTMSSSTITDVTAVAAEADATYNFAPLVQLGVDWRVDENVMVTLASTFSPCWLKKPKVKHALTVSRIAGTRNPESHAAAPLVFTPGADAVATTANFVGETEIDHSPLTFSLSVGWSF